MAGPAPASEAGSRVSGGGASLVALAIVGDLRPPDRADVIVVVTLDGVRWQDVFDGVDRALAERAGMPPDAIVSAPELLPNLHWLIATRGAAVGAPGAGSLAASGPNFVSLPGYLELFTGDPASGGCDDNGCDRVTASTLADDLVNGDLDQVAVFASWPTVGRAASRDPERMVLSVGRNATHPRAVFEADAELERRLVEGDAALPSPGYGAYRPDRHTAALALHYLRSRRPRFLFVGLGDTDEHAHQNDYRAYLDALRAADRVVGEIAVHLAELSAAGTKTMLVVTTDHGRSDGFADHGRRWPESARGWMVAAGDPVRARGRVASPLPRSLADVSATVRAVAGLEPVEVSRPGRVLSELFVPSPATPLARRR